MFHAAAIQDLEAVMRAHRLMKIQQFIRTRRHYSAEPNTPDGRLGAVRRKKFWILIAVSLGLCSIIGLAAWQALTS